MCIWCVYVYACVSWSGGFAIRGFERCNLLWCNIRATDKSELMNGKLLLMIGKMLLSPHVVLDHLSTTEVDLQVQTHSHITHTNQLLPSSLGNQLQNLSLPVILHFALLFSLLYPTFFCFHELIPPPILSSQLTKKGKVKDTGKRKGGEHRRGLKVLCRPLPST